MSTFPVPRSTFHPAASSLANFNDTISTISTAHTLAVLIKIWTNVCHAISAASQLTPFGDSTVNTKSTRRSNTREFSLNSAQWRFQDVKFSSSGFIASKFQRYDTNHFDDWTILSCTLATKEARGFWDVVNFALLSAYWILSTCFLAVLEISVCAY